jgi:hypothetical protein
MRGILAGLAVLGIPALAALALPASALAAAEPAPATKTAPAPELRDIPPIMFFIAKGEADACGPGCDTWIAAHGAFDEGAPQRLRAVLAKAGKRKLPIYFFSPGGSVPGAIEVGRIMRAHKLTAGVGRTIPQGCDPKVMREKACDAIMRAGRELSAELRTARATCNSACVYALFGAAVREVGAGAELGVHSISIRRTLIKTNREGKVLASSSRRITGDTPGIREAHARVARYATAMGISPAVVDTAAKVPFDQVRYLSRDEIVRFGIDARPFVESRWLREEDKSGRPGFLKYVVSATAREPGRHRAALVRISCARSRILVQVARDRSLSENVHSVGMLAGETEIPLRLVGEPAAKDKEKTMEVRAALATPGFFAGAKADRFEIVDVRHGAGGPTERLTLSTAGLAGSLGTLSEGCR